MASPPLPSHIVALTLDLDDTLWPVWPVIVQAEAALHGWLAIHAPATAARFDATGLRLLREQVAQDHPGRTFDFSWLRLKSIEQALLRAGEPPALATGAFEVFIEARQKVALFPEVRAALSSLSRRFPILALTNGNADLHRIGLASHFVDTVSAREFGIGKPDPRIFHEACRRLGARPEQVLHVGDDWLLDIEGAHAAGQPSAWIRRAGHPDKPSGTPARAWRELHALDELATALGCDR